MKTFNGANNYHVLTETLVSDKQSYMENEEKLKEHDTFLQKLKGFGWFPRIVIQGERRQTKSSKYSCN